MRNCIDCKHYIYSDGSTPRHCGVGFDDVFNKWWEDNGRRVRGRDTFDELECYEETEGSKKLGKMMNLLDEMGEILDKK